MLHLHSPSARLQARLPSGRGAAAALVLLASFLAREPAPLEARAGARDGRAAAVPRQGEYRALVVYLRFRDDDAESRDWPVASGSPPAFARSAISSSPDPAEFPPESVTRFFYDQSDPGNRLVLYGHTHPRVLVTAHEEFHYYNRDPAGRSRNGGLGLLTLEILNRIDRDVDFRDFDRNEDGEIDYLFLVVRANPRGRAHRGADRVTFSGVSSLESETRTLTDTKWPAGRPSVSFDGKRLNWTNGAYVFNATPGNIIPRYYHPALWAHEFGHDLWGKFFPGHIQAVTSNDVPANATGNMGYALMSGAGGAYDVGGSDIVSAFERELLGWVDCRPLTTDLPNVTLPDLYATGSCRKIELGGSFSGKTIYVSNYQRTGFFNQLLPFCEGDAYRNGVCTTFYAEAGLKTTGLVVGLRDGLRYDELPADNTLASAIVSGPYQGDLYSPATATQITPWTRPNINGRTKYLRGQAPSWQAIDDIRPGNGSDLVFDFVADFRTRPIVRVDSWIGAETAGHTFTTDIVVKRGATLTVEPGTILRFSGDARVRVEPGGVLALEPGARVELGVSD